MHGIQPIGFHWFSLFSHLIFIWFLSSPQIMFLLIFRDKRRGRGREKNIDLSKKHQSETSNMPGPEIQTKPRYVPWSGTELKTFWWETMLQPNEPPCQGYSHFNCIWWNLKRKVTLDELVFILKYPLLL